MQLRAAKLVGVAYDEEMEVYVQDARDQAERVAADIASTGDRYSVETFSHLNHRACL